MRARWLVVGLVAACGAPPAATPTAMVLPGEVAPRVLMSGALHPLAAADVVAPDTAASQLTVRWLVPSGTVVAAGDRVAELDSTPLAAPLQDARAALATQELALRVERRNDAVQITAKRNAVRRAQMERDTAALHASIPDDLRDRKTAHDDALRLVHADTDLHAAEQDLASTAELLAIRQQLAELDIERARDQIARTESEIASLVLRAPRAGVAIVAPLPWSDRALQVADEVSATTPLVTMPDLGARVEVAARLADVDDGAVSPGMTGTCTLAAFPDRPIACAVDTVAPVAQPGVHRALLRRGFDVALAVTDADACHGKAETGEILLKTDIGHLRRHDTAAAQQICA